ncbi:hypothetical protein ACF08W_34060 [Streptomyces sp. NPDC015144]|uniref:hypothetical protein n=1 Tax=Streptomyces sp. NPDC015144 TaxID=3364944 RepID=UPI0036F9C9AE
MATPIALQSQAPVLSSVLKDQDRGRAVAVMMENYRATDEKYTASEAFIHQWSQVQQLLNQDGVSGSQLKRQAAAALENRTKITDVPDSLPSSLYRQNISGTAAKKVLGALLPEGADTLTFVMPVCQPGCGRQRTRVNPALRSRVVKASAVPKASTLR